MKRLAFLVLTLAIAATSGARAHPLSLSWLSLSVEGREVRGKLEVLVEDFVLFQGLTPGADERLSPETLVAGCRSHVGFLEAYLTLRDGRGNLIPLDVRTPDWDPPPGGVFMTELMNHSVHFELEATFAGDVEHLTISQTFGGQEIGVPAVMNLTVHREGEEIIVNRALPKGAPFSFASRPDVPAPDRPSRSQVGLERYDALYSFLYLTSREARWEVLLPLSLVELWVPIDRAEPDFLTVEEQERATATIGAFLRQRVGVTIDGTPAEAAAPIVEFFSLARRDLASARPAEKLSAASARIGVILRFPARAPARQVTASWDLFPPEAQSHRCTVVTADRTFVHRFFKTKRELTWRNPDPRRTEPEGVRGSIPVAVPVEIPFLSLLLAIPGVLLAAIAIRRRRKFVAIVALVSFVGIAALTWNHRTTLPLATIEGPPLEEFDGTALVHELLSRVYAAIEEPGEERSYDLLDRVAEPPLLEELYLQLRESLTFEEQGGPATTITSLDVLEGSDVELTRDGIRCTARWCVEGTVEHWGHIHSKTAEYEARIGMRRRANEVVLDTVEIRDERDHPVRLRLRRPGESPR